MQELIILHCMHTVGVAYGSGSIEELEKARVHQTMGRPEDLLSLLQWMALLRPTPGSNPAPDHRVAA